MLENTGPPSAKFLRLPSGRSSTMAFELWQLADVLCSTRKGLAVPSDVHERKRRGQIPSTFSLLSAKN